MAPQGRGCREVLVKRKGVNWPEQEVVNISGCCPPIQRMDAYLSNMAACKHLSLSTNSIEKIGSLAGLESLEILSVGRNLLKRIENLDAVAGTLRQLWISYNQLDKLVSGWHYDCVVQQVCGSDGCGHNSQNTHLRLGWKRHGVYASCMPPITG